MTLCEYLTVAQAASESGQSKITIRRHIDKGALKAERWGPYRRIRITRREFDRYLRPVVYASVRSSNHHTT